MMLKLKWPNLLLGDLGGRRGFYISLTTIKYS
jgi:hypothetical protein